ncbi:MAG: hypothetical protein IKG46_05170 [Solobacterium sp.]|nr:hypothetical protein [Solobacterium sp.]
MYTSNYYESFAVLSVIRSARVIKIRWRVRSEFHYQSTFLYRHSDGTWHMDADSVKRGPLFASLIRDALASRPEHKPVKENMYRDVRGGGDVAKTEYSLKIDSMYHQNRKEALARQMLENGEIDRLPNTSSRSHSPSARRSGKLYSGSGRKEE